MELAQFPNVVCKISGLVTEADHQTWTPEDLKPYIDHTISSFGWERVMFGSDWPVCLLAASYAQVLECFQSLLEQLNDQDRALIFGENAMECYHLRGEARSA